VQADGCCGGCALDAQLVLHGSADGVGRVLDLPAERSTHCPLQPKGCKTARFVEQLWQEVVGAVWLQLQV
jgi:hypothetical protein